MIKTLHFLITTDVLEGATLRATAKEYHLSSERIRQIVNKTIKKHAAPYYKPKTHLSWYRTFAATKIINELWMDLTNNEPER